MPVESIWFGSIIGVIIVLGSLVSFLGKRKRWKLEKRWRQARYRAVQAHELASRSPNPLKSLDRIKKAHARVSAASKGEAQAVDQVTEVLAEHMRRREAGEFSMPTAAFAESSILDFRLTGPEWREEAAFEELVEAWEEFAEAWEELAGSEPSEGSASIPGTA